MTEMQIRIMFEGLSVAVTSPETNDSYVVEDNVNLHDKDVRAVRYDVKKHEKALGIDARLKHRHNKRIAGATLTQEQ